MFGFTLTVLSLTSIALCKDPKRGIAYPSANNNADVLNYNQTDNHISWQYDWGLHVPPYLASSGIEYIPMQWGAGNIENLSTAIQAEGAKILLGFNEPDFKDQSNIDPNYAAQLWMQYFEPLKAQGVRLGGPAVSSAPSGFPWLETFFAACSNCTIDFLPVHWYGQGVAGFYDYLWQMRSKFGNRTIWVTEYASTSLNESEVADFMNQTTKYLDELEWVERFAWFGYFRPENGSAYNFLNTDGSLNNLGKEYIGQDTVVRSGPVTTTPEAGAAGPTKPYETATAGAGRAPSFLPSNNAGLTKWDVPVIAVDEFGFISHFDHATSPSSTRLVEAEHDRLEVLGPGNFIIPSFCDLHLHAPQFLYQGNGLHLPLMQWLNEYAFKAEERLDADPDLARRVYTRLANRLIENGTGSVLLFGTIREETNVILAEVLAQAGLRGFVGKLSMDMSTRSSYVEGSAKDSLTSIASFTEKMKNLTSRLPSHKRLVEPVVTPRFVPTCSDELLEGLGNFAKQHSLRIQSHLAEAHDQVEWVRRERGAEDIEVFDKHGLLTPRTIQAHCTFLDSHALNYISSRQSAIAHCPLSNAYFSAEPFRLREALNKGVKVGLGTDIAGGYSTDIMNAMRQAVIVSRIREGSRIMATREGDIEEHLSIDWKEALYLATRGGALALNLPHGTGTFQVGAPFDAQHINLFDRETMQGIGVIDCFDVNMATSITEELVEKWWCIGDSRNRVDMWVQGAKPVML
ncbi:atrazine chlorohydrolase guanine deaminase [Moniliophthora roreri]|nr:atrazine chlorohydrolase guanine deaminase [Moniliophthora roreri]